MLVDAALGLTSPPSETPALIRPQGIREILVSLTITNPLATRVLLQSLIEKKERALPEYVEILQRPTTLRNSTPDIAGWLYYFAGDDRTAHSADRGAYPRLSIPAAILWGDKYSITPLDQAHDLQKLLPQADRAAGTRSYSANRGPRRLQHRFAHGAREAVNSQQQIRAGWRRSWTSSGCAPGATQPCSAL